MHAPLHPPLASLRITTLVALPLSLCLLLLGCLPDRLSDGEIDDAIKASESCGNGIIDLLKEESCDDSNDKYCDGCENCSKRQVLEINNAQDTLIIQTNTLDELKISKEQQFSVEFWFKLKNPLLEDDRLVIFSRGLKGSGRAFGIGLIGAEGSNGTYPVCVLTLADKLPQAKNTTILAAVDYTLKPGEWHHIVCGYDGKRGMLGLSANLNSLKETSVHHLPTFKTDDDLFADNDFIGFGSVENLSDATDVPFVGLIDELRWSPTYPSKQPSFNRRYDDDEPNTTFLFHLDDSVSNIPNSVNSADKKISASTVLSTHSLSFVPDNCYGTDAAAMLCEFSDAPAPWCKNAPK